jgi:DNA primase
MSTSSETWQLGSQTVWVSHLEKLYWPEVKFTKGDMLHYPTVSTPLTWEELASGNIHPADLTPQVVLERIQRLGDLFAPVLQKKRNFLKSQNEKGR